MSNMESLTQRYLTRLRLISKIPEGGKISTVNNDLNIYTF